MSRAARVRARVARVPRALWICATLALINGITWSVLTPPFQIPDEPVHVGYAQYIGETGRIPRPLVNGFYWSPPEDTRTAFSSMPFSTVAHPSWKEADDRALQRKLSRPLGSVAEGGAGYASRNPPLYYIYAGVVYRVAKSGDILDRIEAMRIATALLAALTVAFVFLFLRELLPRTPWAWTVGALAVAFQPLFGFMAGGVNNDNLVYLAGAALLAGLARAFRRGLTPLLGVGIGAAVAVGLLTKASMFALVPGTAFGLVVAALRMGREQRSRALKALLAAGLAAAIPFAIWFLANHALYGRPAGAATTSLDTGASFKVHELVSYVWQFYLPRPGFMDDQFPYAHMGFPKYPVYPLWQTFVQGLVGRFGWFQFGFPEWADVVGLVIYVAALVLAGLALWRSRLALRRRLLELVTYALLLLGLLALVNIAGYQYRLTPPHGNFEQTRYLLPLVGLYAAVLALAARGAGRRWGPAVGVLIVVLAVGHNIFGQLLTMDRYYNAKNSPLVNEAPPTAPKDLKNVKRP